eukprot:15343034-Alexandrium_andersonii.AAC.1
MADEESDGPIGLIQLHDAVFGWRGAPNVWACTAPRLGCFGGAERLPGTHFYVPPLVRGVRPGLEAQGRFVVYG